MMCIFNTAPTGQNKPAQGNPPWVSKGGTQPLEWRPTLSIKEMANELAVGIPTIGRDLQRLACIGIPFVGINRERNDTVLPRPRAIMANLVQLRVIDADPLQLVTRGIRQKGLSRRSTWDRPHAES